MGCILGCFSSDFLPPFNIGLYEFCMQAIYVIGGFSSKKVWQPRRWSVERMRHATAAGACSAPERERERSGAFALNVIECCRLSPDG